MTGGTAWFRVSALSLMALACLLPGSAFGRAPASRVTPTVTFANWSGYIVTSRNANPVKYKSVTGTWTVPPSTCAKHGGATSSSVWVGLGGYATVNTEQVGTNSNCKDGKPVYFAWFELSPYLSYNTFPNIDGKVSPGDTITGLVQILSYRLVKLEIHNVTEGWTFARSINFSMQDTSTADWIMAAPATCVYTDCIQASLTNFGRVHMRNISAVGNGASGTLVDNRWEVIPIRLVPTDLVVPTVDPNPDAITSGKRGQMGQAKSPAGATPGQFSADGTSFDIHWVAIARKDV